LNHEGMLMKNNEKHCFKYTKKSARTKEQDLDNDNEKTYTLCYKSAENSMKN
jgi:hypothetical protein